MSSKAELNSSGAVGPLICALKKQLSSVWFYSPREGPNWPKEKGSSKQIPLH